MSFEHKANHRQDAVKRLLFIYQDKPRICALVKALAGAAQTVEDALASLVFDTLFAKATGVVLDLWGRLIGEERSGLPDDLFRRVIEARILTNRSKGDTDSMIEIVETLFPGVMVREQARYPAGSTIFVGPISVRVYPREQYIARARAIVRLARPAAVGVGGIIFRVGYFGFASDPDALGFNQGTFADSF